MRLQDDPVRLLTASYPFTFELRILYSDMDSFRHVNNGAIARYFEEGRAALHMDVFGADCFTDPRPGAQLLFAQVTMEYLRQVNYPGAITICSAIGRIGTSSFVQVQAAFQDGQCCALGDVVVVKAQDGRPTPVTPDERGRLSALALRK